MPFDDGTVDTSGIGQMLVSSRSLAECRAMFALTKQDLAGSMLDCPAGAASFTAEVNAAGGDATACDPIYAAHSAGELATRSWEETDRGIPTCAPIPSNTGGVSSPTRTNTNARVERLVRASPLTWTATRSAT